MTMFDCPWLWLYAGVLLMLLEILSPGFVVFFFGLAAATVGVLRFAFGDALTLTWQLAAFSALTLVYLVFLRRWLKKVFSGDASPEVAGLGDEYAGRVGRVTTAVRPPQTGRVLVGDAEWTAEADAPLAVGADVRVVSRRNLTLKVAPLGAG